MPWNSFNASTWLSPVITASTRPSTADDGLKDLTGWYGAEGHEAAARLAPTVGTIAQ
jgi:hypothetical protein